MKLVVLALMTALLGLSADVDIYSPQAIKTMTDKLSLKGGGFSSEPLKKYGNHYTMIAHREATGHSEVHEKEADIFVITEGTATILTGGKLVNSHMEKAGELRGTSIAGGEKHILEQGSIIHIPAGVPHQVVLENGKPFTYFVVKVIEN